MVMEIWFKTIYFDRGDTYGLCARLLDPDGTERMNTITFPTNITAQQAADKLRSLAVWIEETIK